MMLTGCSTPFGPSLNIEPSTQYAYTSQECATLELLCIDIGVFSFLGHGVCKCEPFDN
tara:strand:- start:8710 stop:8883 length:174 start_codon:yes stop_codon:yes gene_type:complete